MTLLEYKTSPSRSKMPSQEGHESGGIGVFMPIKQLQTKSHEEILDVIDQLRSEGISKYVDLPQMIVCGDQSSGKSSVLEAISGLNFPRKESLCTRFATELILRRDPESRIKVSILPNRERPEKEQRRLEAFQPVNTALELFDKIVNEAGAAMKVGEYEQSFAKDVLRVEIYGPTQPHLTLVDLPGLYHAPDERQDEDGIARVEALVRSYIEKPRSVILAVISAKSEISLQKVTALVREVDPEGTRTLGIITKPDTLSRGSEQEQSFFVLAKNNNTRVKFRWGWHVLKNRNYEERDSSLADRNASESRFLAQGIWSSLPPPRVGITTLVPKLCDILRDHNLSQMPSFIADTKSAFKDTSTDLQKLGDKRNTLPDQRRYLLRGSQRFSTLVNDSLNGSYFDSFFGTALEDGCYRKRLRAVIQDRLASFAETMEERGEYTKILEEEADDDRERKCIYRTDFVEDVRKRMRRNRGRELPGNFNPLIVGELFYEQARPWKSIVNECTDSLLGDVRNATVSILQDVFDQYSVEGLLKHVVNHRLSRLGDELYTKTAELLRPQQSGHPITYNSQYIRNIQEMRGRQMRDSIARKFKAFFGNDYPDNARSGGPFYFNMQDLVDKVSSQSESDMERFACSDAIDCMLAYYRVAMEKFVDDFSNLAVEECLVKPLRQIFDPSTVESMGHVLIKEIACEDEDATAERDRLMQKQDVLRSCLRQMDEYNLRVSLVEHGDNRAEHEEHVTPEEDDESHVEVNSDHSSPVVATIEPEEVSSEVQIEEMTEPVLEAPNDWPESLPSPTSKRKKKHRIASQFEYS